MELSAPEIKSPTGFFLKGEVTVGFAPGVLRLTLAAGNVRTQSDKPARSGIDATLITAVTDWIDLEIFLR